MQNAMIPAAKVSSLGEEEAHRILIEWNRTAQAYDQTETVWGLIETHAEVHPKQTAIIDGAMEIDYERLTVRANAIAGELLARHVTGAALPHYAAAFSPSRYDDPAYVKLIETWDVSGQL